MVLPNILLKKLMIEIKASDLILIEIAIRNFQDRFKSSKPPLHDAPAPDSSTLSLASPSIRDSSDTYTLSYIARFLDFPCWQIKKLVEL